MLGITFILFLKSRHSWEAQRFMLHRGKYFPFERIYSLHSNTSAPWEVLSLLNGKHFLSCSETQRFLLYLNITFFYLGKHFHFEANVFCYKGMHQLLGKYLPCLIRTIFLLVVKHSAFYCTSTLHFPSWELLPFWRNTFCCKALHQVHGKCFPWIMGITSLLVVKYTLPAAHQYTLFLTPCMMVKICYAA